MNSFLKMLGNKGKIRITEPSSIICKSYIEKSQRSLTSAKTLLSIGNHDDAIALTYYSMYHITLALLYRCGIKSENHAGTAMMLAVVFGIDNASLLQAKKDLIDKQYFTDFTTNRKEVLQAISNAEEYNAQLREFIEKLSINRINSYSQKAHKQLEH